MRFVVAVLAALIPAVAFAQALPQPQVATQPINDNSSRAASTGYVDRAMQAFAPRVSPTFAGTVTAPALALTAAGSTGPGDGFTVRTPANQALALGSLLQTLPTQTPYHYGYPLGGTGDVTQAVQACVNAVKTCYLPARSQGWTLGAVTLPAGGALYGVLGKPTVTTTGGSYATFTFAGSDGAVDNLNLQNAAKTGGCDFTIQAGTGVVERVMVRSVVSYQPPCMITDSGDGSQGLGYHVSTRLEMYQGRAVRGPGVTFTRAFAFTFLDKVAVDYNGSSSPNWTGVTIDGTTLTQGAAGGAILRDIDVLGTAGTAGTTNSQTGYLIKGLAEVWLVRSTADTLGGAGYSFQTLNKLHVDDLNAGLDNGTPVRFDNVQNSDGRMVRVFGRNGLTGATTNLNGIEFGSGNTNILFSDVFVRDMTGNGIAKLAAQGGPVTISNLNSTANVGRGVFSRGDSVFSLTGGIINANTAGNYDMTGAYDYLSSMILSSGARVNVGPNPGVQ